MNTFKTHINYFNKKNHAHENHQLIFDNLLQGSQGMQFRVELHTAVLKC